MAYPPQLPPTTRTDSTISAGTHASDHNQLAAALRDFLAELGANPAGSYASLTDRLLGIAAGQDQAALEEFRQARSDLADALAEALDAADRAGLIAIGDVDATIATLALPTSASELADTLLKNYARKTIIRTEHLRVWGHSFAAGVGPGVTAATQGLAPLTAKALGLPLSNLAVGGSTLIDGTALAGWAAIMEAEKRPRARFVPRGGVFAMLHGINDLNRLGNTVAGLLPYRHAYRAAVARFRCATVFEDSDETVTLGGAGAWQTTSTTGASGNGLRYNLTSGATITINTPANFPGGTIDLGFITWQGGGGGTITGPASLGSPVLNTLEAAYSDARTTSVMRIKNVPKGAASYTFTTSAVTGNVGVVFDWWGWEPDELAAPIVAIISQTKPLDYDGYGAGGAFGPPTDAGVDAINSIHQDVADEFGDRTVYVDCSWIDKRPGYWAAGNVHPNVDGHAYIAEQLTKAIAASSSFVVVGDTDTGAPAGWAPFTPVLGGSGNTLGTGGEASGAYTKQADGTVHFHARIKLGTGGAIASAPQLSLPVPPAAVLTPGSVTTHILDAGTGYHPAQAWIASGAVYITAYGGVGGSLREVTATIPLTWAAGDEIRYAGTYRTA